MVLGNFIATGADGLETLCTAFGFDTRCCPVTVHGRTVPSGPLPGGAAACYRDGGRGLPVPQQPGHVCGPGGFAGQAPVQ